MQMMIDLNKCEKFEGNLSLNDAETFTNSQATREMFKNEEEYVKHLEKYVNAYRLNSFNLSGLDVICVDASMPEDMVYIGRLIECDGVYDFTYDLLIGDAKIENNILQFDTDSINFYCEENFSWKN